MKFAHASTTNPFKIEHYREGDIQPYDSQKLLSAIDTYLKNHRPQFSNKFYRFFSDPITHYDRKEDFLKKLIELINNFEDPFQEKSNTAYALVDQLYKGAKDSCGDGLNESSELTTLLGMWYWRLVKHCTEKKIPIIPPQSSQEMQTMQKMPTL